MAAAYELKGSRAYNGGNQLDFKYIVYRSDDIDEIYQTVVAVAPNPFGVWTPQYQKVNLDPVGGGVWNVTLPYGVGDTPITGAPGAPAGPGGTPPPPPPAPTADQALGPEWSFDTTGGTAHATQRYPSPTAGRYAILRSDLPGDPPATNGAIGLDNDGKVNGVDITVPNQRFTYTTKFPVITHGYLQVIERLTGSVNSQPYLNRAARELLFMGASGSWKQVEGWTVTFQWAFSPNLPNLEPTTGLVIPDKPGWYHLWFMYEQAPSNGFVITRPAVAFVDQIYPEENFDQLGLFS